MKFAVGDKLKLRSQEAAYRWTVVEANATTYKLDGGDPDLLEYPHATAEKILEVVPTKTPTTRLTVSIMGKKITVEKLGEIVGKLKEQGFPIISAELVEEAVEALPEPEVPVRRRNIDLD